MRVEPAGYQLGRVQQGLAPTDWKPMTAVGTGVVEIRVHTKLEHRVFYVAKFEETVYVIHAFEKRTRKTSPSDIALAQKRFADLMQRRAQKPRSRNYEDSSIDRQRVPRSRIL
jgi:phage-related protein